MTNKISLKELFFPLAIILGIFFIFYFARKTFLVLIFSISFSYILNPIIKFFEVRGIKRTYVVIGLYMFVGIILFTTFILVINMASIDIDSFINSWPNYYERISNLWNKFYNIASVRFPFVQQIEIKERFLNLIVKIPSYILSLVPYSALLFIIPFVSFFIMIKGSKILDIIVENIPSRYVEIVYYIVSKIDNSLGNYIRGIITDATIMFLLSFFGLFLLGIDYYSIIAVLVGISSIIPYVGAIVGSIVASIIAFLQYATIDAVIKVLIFFAFMRFLDDWFIQPYIIQKSINLNPSIVVIGLMVGGEIAGFWGVLFAVPVICIIRELISIIFEIHRSIFKWKLPKESLKLNIPYT